MCQVSIKINIFIKFFVTRTFTIYTAVVACTNSKIGKSTLGCAVIRGSTISRQHDDSPPSLTGQQNKMVSITKKWKSVNITTLRLRHYSHPDDYYYHHHRRHHHHYYHLFHSVLFNNRVATCYIGILLFCSGAKLSKFTVVCEQNYYMQLFLFAGFFL